MAQGLTKSQVTDHQAEKVGTTPKMARQFLQALAALAYKEASNVFTLPGIGKLRVAHRQARRGRTTRTGNPLQLGIEPDRGRPPVREATPGLFQRSRATLHRSQAGAAHPVMGNQLERVAVMYEGVLAGDPLIDRDHQLFFSHQLSDVLPQAGLTEDQLPDHDRLRDLAGKIPLPIVGLQLAHQRNSDHRRSGTRGTLTGAPDGAQPCFPLRPETT